MDCEHTRAGTVSGFHPCFDNDHTKNSLEEFTNERRNFKHGTSMLIFNRAKVPKQFIGGKEGIFSKVLEQLDVHMERNESSSLPHIIDKINLRWIMEVYVKLKL